MARLGINSADGLREIESSLGAIRRDTGLLKWMLGANTVPLLAVHAMLFVR